jgi:PHD/YefM family antitoxin component YafN of YafNO toxin-antitoxin module
MVPVPFTEICVHAGVLCQQDIVGGIITEGGIRMIQIKPMSELCDNLPAIEKIVNDGSPVYLTKNGYGAMVLLSLEQYTTITDNVEFKLDEADKAAALSDERMTHDAVFAKYKHGA